MFLVDPAEPLDEDHINRGLGANVKRAINVYQTNDRWIKGGSRFTSKNGNTILGNVDLSGAKGSDGEAMNHTNIDETTEGKIGDFILETLNEPKKNEPSKKK